MKKNLSERLSKTRFPIKKKNVDSIADLDSPNPDPHSTATLSAESGTAIFFHDFPVWIPKTVTALGYLRRSQ
jgi:hypothetical protein